MLVRSVGWSFSLLKELELCHDLPLISSNGSVPRTEVWLLLV